MNITSAKYVFKAPLSMHKMLYFKFPQCNTTFYVLEVMIGIHVQTLSFIFKFKALFQLS